MDGRTAEHAHNLVALTGAPHHIDSFATEGLRRRDLTAGEASGAHWTWEFETPQGRLLGKRRVINDSCISVATNEADCAACHTHDNSQWVAT